MNAKRFELFLHFFAINKTLYVNNENRNFNIPFLLKSVNNPLLIYIRRRILYLIFVDHASKCYFLIGVEYK